MGVSGAVREVPHAFGSWRCEGFAGSGIVGWRCTGCGSELGLPPMDSPRPRCGGCLKAAEEFEWELAGAAAEGDMVNKVWRHRPCKLVSATSGPPPSSCWACTREEARRQAWERWWT